VYVVVLYGLQVSSRAPSEAEAEGAGWGTSFSPIRLRAGTPYVGSGRDDADGSMERLPGVIYYIKLGKTQFFFLAPHNFYQK
jgi:hypothetical protein